MNKKTELDVADPKLPRKRKLIDFYHSQSSDEFLPRSSKKIYRQLYFENFYNIINCIKDSFNQKDYQIYVHLQEILMKVFKEQDWENDLLIVIQNYGVNEYDNPSLKTQLLLLPEIAQFYGLDSTMQLPEMIALFQNLDTIKRMLVWEVIKLVKLVLVMPATNAVSDKSFSSLKRIKTYLCSATANNRLNHLLILHIHKLLTERLDLTKVLMSSLKEEKEQNQYLHGTIFCTPVRKDLYIRNFASVTW